MRAPPFVVGKPVTGLYFIDREEELTKLRELLVGIRRGATSNVALIGLRRTGKTSILVNLMAALGADRSVVPVIFDCYGTSTKSRFARLYIEAVVRSYIEKTGDESYAEKVTSIIKRGLGKVSDRLSDFEVSVGDYLRFHLKLQKAEVDEDDLLESALMYPEVLARAKRVYFVMIMDEFQELLKWKEPFLKNLRRIIQSQRRASYCFAGSSTTIMRDLAYDSRSPFYRQLIELTIGRLPRDPVKKFVQSRLRSVGIRIEQAALETFVEKTECYPDYVQRLGLLIYLDKLATGTPRVSPGDIVGAYGEMVRQLDGEFSTYFNTFSDLEKEVLIALANGRLTPSSVAREIRKPITSIPQILARLINHGIAEKFTRGRYRVADPVLSDWLRGRYRLP